MVLKCRIGISQNPVPFDAEHVFKEIHLPAHPPLLTLIISLLTHITLATEKTC